MYYKSLSLPWVIVLKWASRISWSSHILVNFFNYFQFLILFPHFSWWMKCFWKTKNLFGSIFSSRLFVFTDSFECWQFLITYVFSLSLKFEARDITGSDCSFIFIYTFVALFFSAFHQKNCVFMIFISFLMKYKIMTTEY